MDNLPIPHNPLNPKPFRIPWAGRHRVSNLVHALKHDFRVLSLEQIMLHSPWSVASAKKKLKALLRDGILCSQNVDTPAIPDVFAATEFPSIVAKPGESLEETSIRVVPEYVGCVDSDRLERWLVHEDKPIDPFAERWSDNPPKAYSRTVFASSREQLDYALSRPAGIEEELHVFWMCCRWLTMTELYELPSTPRGVWQLNPPPPDTPDAATIPDVLIVGPENRAFAAMDIGRPWYTPRHLRALKRYCDERNLVLFVW